MLNDKTLSLLLALSRPLSPAYSALMKARAWAYKKGYLTTRRLPCSVISIGNLSLGGTGKTPHVLAIANWLKSRGISPAVVSRGYGGRAGRGPLVVSDGTRVLFSPRDAGDEPVMMAEALSGIPVVVGSDRYAGGKLAVERFGAQAIVLDDGFQHMALFRNVDLVLLPAINFFGTQWVFPGGDLREPVSALSRATAILLTRAEALSLADREICRRELQTMVPGRPVFLSEMRATRFLSMEGKVETPDALTGEPLFAVCAIAGPEFFFAILENLETNLKGRVAFSDHYSYKKDDLRKFMAQAEKQGAKALVTTHKDRVKIEPIWREFTANDEKPLPVWVLEIEAWPEEGFWNMLETSLNIGKI
ncbi:MAG: tetraacyldisaccharide 4'-kinase [Thermodesulfobacteriota bacterium]|nr:tetraacyldisaccharide 4'-kinase [Thermodesulfobacteriota bacterium]